MSRTREQRVDEALKSLVELSLPANEESDEARADELFQRACNRARGFLIAESASPSAQDASHVADLIRKKLIRESDVPDNALEFSRLYSRLLSQPVLSQKSAILDLLYRLSSGQEPTPTTSKANAPQWTSTRYQDEESLNRSSRLRSHEPYEERGIHSDLRARLGASRTSPDTAIHSDRTQQTRTAVENSRSRLANNEDVPYAQKRDMRPALSRNPQDRVLPSRETEDLTKPRRIEPSPSEAGLLRDLPFILQGVSSTNFSFSPTSPVLSLPPTLPGPIIFLLHTLAEPSLLYKELCGFVESSEGGLIVQSLRSTIGTELRSYLGLVATLEGQIRRALSVIDEAEPRSSSGRAGVTLKRCVIWTRDATMGLRFMALIADQSKTRKGGQIISLIHSFASSHGDPFVSAFAERLLSNVTRPFYDMLRRWIYDGELLDPHLEFLVLENPKAVDADEGRGHAVSVWQDKYALDEQMIPSIVTEDFARKVFLIGKSLNFIRYGCGDAAWVERYSRGASKELRYGDTATLGASIDEAYKTTMARLVHLMNDKFKLYEHLVALKKYLLLGQGDFIAILMESLSANLDRPANSQYRHTLTAQLEHAVEHSNAQYESPEVLQRLDARMLEMTHGDIGWDVFTLEYKVPPPVDVVVDKKGSKEYLKVFNFLWRVKRVEYALGSSWRRCMTGARGVIGNVADKVGKEWKIARCTISEMIHFVDQLQYYILFEVIEASWDQLQKAMVKPDCTLDDLIQAHDKYLKSITRKGLLGHSSMEFTVQLHELLKVMLAYKDAVDGLYSYSVAEFTRRQQTSSGSGSRTSQLKRRNTDQDEEDRSRSRDGARFRDVGSPVPAALLAIGGSRGDADVLAALNQRLTELASDFRTRVCGLLGDLAHQSDPDMRFLGVVMNFNNTYEITRRTRKRAPEADRRRERDKGTTAGASEREKRA